MYSNFTSICMIYAEDRGIFYELNTNDFTANIIRSKNANFDVFIPSKITHESNEYTIKIVKERAFSDNPFIQSIEFANDSEVEIIEKDAFSSPNLREISIPSSINELQEGWCHHTPELTKISISPLNKKYSYIRNKLIVGKKRATDDTYEILIFARRDIKKVVIPSYIKHISSFCFSECYELETIKLNENLLTIGNEAFSFTSLKNILIPSNVNEIKEGWCRGISELTSIDISHKNSNFKSIENGVMIGKSDTKSNIFDTLYFVPRDIEQVSIPSYIKHINSYSFSECYNLQSIAFDDFDNSDLISIGRGAFMSSSIQSISLPSNTIQLDDGWCRNTTELTDIFISEKNQTFSMDIQKLIIGKSTDKIDGFDTLYFASRDIQAAFIPSSIKKISSFSFYQCCKLKTVKFQSNSKLNELGEYSFSNSAIERIDIPESVSKLGECSFFGCSKLKKVTFFERSKIGEILSGTFAFSAIESISIPSNHACKNGFLSCEKLKAIEFLSDEICIEFFAVVKCYSLSLISFPYAKKISLNYEGLYELSSDLSIFTIQKTNLIYFK